MKNQEKVNQDQYHKNIDSNSNKNINHQNPERDKNINQGNEKNQPNPAPRESNK